jgi:hypothetical protein
MFLLDLTPGNARRMLAPRPVLPHAGDGRRCAPPLRTPREVRRLRVRLMVRAVQYRRGGMFLAVLRWHAARGHAGQHEHAAQAAVRSCCGQAPGGSGPPGDLPADAALPSIPSSPAVLARAVLTAAPPASRALVPAGAAA